MLIPFLQSDSHKISAILSLSCIQVGSSFLPMIFFFSFLFPCTYSFPFMSRHLDLSIFNYKSFQAIDAEGMDMEIDLSNLGTVNTMFAALFR